MTSCYTIYKIDILSDQEAFSFPVKILAGNQIGAGVFSDEVRIAGIPIVNRGELVLCRHMWRWVQRTLNIEEIVALAEHHIDHLNGRDLVVISNSRGTEVHLAEADAARVGQRYRTLVLSAFTKQWAFDKREYQIRPHAETFERSFGQGTG